MEMNQFRWNTLSDKLFSTNIRFGVQAKGNSEMDYGKPLLLVRVQWNSPLITVSSSVPEKHPHIFLKENPVIKCGHPVNTANCHILKTQPVKSFTILLPLNGQLNQLHVYSSFQYVCMYMYEMIEVLFLIL